MIYSALVVRAKGRPANTSSAKVALRKAFFTIDLDGPMAFLHVRCSQPLVFARSSVSKNGFHSVNQNSDCHIFV
jgi:hypothetical protein